MACKEIHSWTFTGLVGAFLDLAIAYVLLCGSTLAFFTSKFLGVFGLSLPCRCDGLFGKSNKDRCFQKLLLDRPSNKVSTIQLSVSSKFPFDTIWSKDQNCQLNLKFVRKEDDADGFIKWEGEGLCRLYLDAKGSIPKIEPDVGFGSVKGRFDNMGKGTKGKRPRSSLRRRRKTGVDSGDIEFVTAYESSCSDNVRPTLQSTSGVNKTWDETYQEVINPLTPESGGFHYARDNVISFEDIASHNKWNRASGKNNCTDKDPLFVNEFRCNAHDKLGFDGNDEDAIKALVRKLDEEQAARAAVHLELEKERSSAATAAHEAMAMISRLQEEKASIEMDARQYERMIEEKCAYDAEEMNILKEILVRRERENHFLEKEIKAYKQTLFLGDDNHLNGVEHMEGKRDASWSNSVEDPILMLHLNNAAKCEDYEATPVGKSLLIPGRDDVELSKQENAQRKLSLGEINPPTSRQGNEGNQEFEEKGVVYMDGPLYSQEGQRFGAGLQFCESVSPQKHNLVEKTISPLSEEQVQNNEIKLCQGNGPMIGETHKEAVMFIQNDPQVPEKHMKDHDHGNKDTLNPIVDLEHRVHDVHVIDDESNLHNAVGGNKIEISMDVATSEVSRKCDFSFKAEPDVNRRSSVVTGKLPQMSKLHGKALVSNTVRRNTISAFELDNEKLKIVSEVDWLKERLRIVQEEREKFNFSVGHKEREKLLLRLLEDIASQLREIRQLTEPERYARQVSLPPPSSEVLSKKRRCRSVSLGLQQSI